MSNKEKTDRAIAIVVVLLALGFILYQVLGGLSTFLDSEEIVEHQDLSSLVINEKEYIKVEDTTFSEELGKNEVTSSDEPIQELHEVSHDDDKIIGIDSSRQRNITDDQGTSDTIYSPSQKTFSIQEEDTLLNKVETTIDDEVKVVEENIEEAPVEVEMKETDVSQYCIIVIGAFNESRNTSKLKERLDKDGYDIFEVPFRGLTRIGVYIPCENSTNQLRKVRRLYASDAFIFKEK